MKIFVFQLSSSITFCLLLPITCHLPHHNLRLSHNRCHRHQGNTALGASHLRRPTVWPLPTPLVISLLLLPSARPPPPCLLTPCRILYHNVSDKLSENHCSIENTGAIQMKKEETSNATVSNWSKHLCSQKRHPQWHQASPLTTIVIPSADCNLASKHRQCSNDKIIKGSGRGSCCRHNCQREQWRLLFQMLLMAM